MGAEASQVPPVLLVIHLRRGSLLVQRRSMKHCGVSYRDRESIL